MQKGSKRSEESNMKARLTTLRKWLDGISDDEFWSIFQTHMKDRVMRIQNRKKLDASR
jgi:hypothetical protein